jgi:5-methylcytosine-specific restriction endonuclease McrA
MTSLPRRCLGCGQLIRGRCTACEARRQAKRNRGSTTARGYGAAWQAISRAVLARDGYRCRYCGGLASTTDHVVAKARGGTDDPSNLVACCRSCNSKKGTASGRSLDFGSAKAGDADPKLPSVF